MAKSFFMQAAWNWEQFRRNCVSVSADRRRYGQIHVSFLQSPYHAKETPKERGRKPKPNKSGHSPLSPTVSPCLEKASTHLFPTLSPPLSPLLQFVFNFLFISCIEYCFGPFTAAPLICGLAFRYQVSAVSFAWLCGGDWVYCPPYFNQSANVLIALTVSKGIS